MLLYVFAGCDVTLATSYWVNQRKRKKLPSLLTSDMKRRIGDIFLSYSDSALATLVDADSPSEKKLADRLLISKTK